MSKFLLENHQIDTSPTVQLSVFYDYEIVDNRYKFDISVRITYPDNYSYDDYKHACDIYFNGQSLFNNQIKAFVSGMQLPKGQTYTSVVTFYLDEKPAEISIGINEYRKNGNEDVHAVLYTGDLIDENPDIEDLPNLHNKIYINVSGSYKKGTCYIKKDDAFVKANKVFIKDNNTWKLSV